MIQSITRLGIIIGIAFILNVIGQWVFTKIDLTEDQRFTLSEQTIKMIKSTPEPVYVRILLEGEFPAGFKRLQKSTTEILDEFRSYNGNIDYAFEDPNVGTTEEINLRRQQMTEQGINPINLRLKETDGSSQKMIYPYAIITYGSRQQTINLLENQAQGQSDQLVLNNSINLLEYKLANAIQKLQMDRKPLIAFTYGHGELEEPQVRDLVKSLRSFYDVGRYSLDSNAVVPKEVKLLMIAKPRGSFSQKDKFKIDQYIMNGGKVVFLLDKLNAELDSLRTTESFVPLEYQTDLDDLLFKYGVRLQTNLILDLQCSSIPQVIGMQGGQPQIELFPWYYHPIVGPASDHPIVRNLNYVNLFFPSTIDLVETKTDIKKTVLLTSSDKTRVQLSPVRLSFEILKYGAEPDKFNKPKQPVAVLLEGKFPSLYANRLSDEMAAGLKAINQPFKAESTENSILVVSDGDIIANTVTDPSTGAFMPLGYNRYDRNQYANKDFMVNAVEYMMGDDGMIAARSKDVKLRLIDTVKAKQEAGMWQLINVGLPLMLLAIFAFVFHYLRKRKYA